MNVSVACPRATTGKESCEIRQSFYRNVSGDAADLMHQTHNRVIANFCLTLQNTQLEKIAWQHCFIFIMLKFVLIPLEFYVFNGICIILIIMGKLLPAAWELVGEMTGRDHRNQGQKKVDWTKGCLALS